MGFGRLDKSHIIGKRIYGFQTKGGIDNMSKETKTDNAPVKRTDFDIAVSKLNTCMGNIYKNITKLGKARKNVIKANDEKLTSRYNKHLDQMISDLESQKLTEDDFKNPTETKKESFNLMA